MNLQTNKKQPNTTEKKPRENSNIVKSLGPSDCTPHHSAPDSTLESF